MAAGSAGSAVSAGSAGSVVANSMAVAKRFAAVEPVVESELESLVQVCLVEVGSVVPGSSLLRHPSVVGVVVVVDSALETPVELEDLVVGAKKRPS